MFTLSDIGRLTKEQREAVAGFVLTFPANASVTLIETPAAEEPNPAKVFGEHPVAATPAAPVLIMPPPPPPPPAAGNVDKNGLPWDERIYSSSKNFNTDGTWRLRRGVDKALVEQVEAELRKVMGISAPSLPPQPTPSQAAPVTPATPIAIVPPAPAAATEEMTADRAGFVKMIGFVSSLINDQRMTKEEVENIILAESDGAVPNLAMLGNRLDLLPKVFKAVTANLQGR